MRLQLTIDHLPRQVLPINYQYLLSSWIYNVLYDSDKEFAGWLHEHGYQIKGKRYKHFCFSMLEPQRYTNYRKNQTFELTEGPTQLILSFNIDKAMKEMVKGLFQNNLIQLKSGEFNMLGIVNQVQLLPVPKFEESMQFRTVTPICISVGTAEKEHAEYLNPFDERYAEAFAANLVDKANASLDIEKYDTNQVSFRLLTKEPKPKLWRIKGISIKGYLFEFELKAPKELMEIGYFAGFGVQGSSIGMGMVEVLRDVVILTR